MQNKIKLGTLKSNIFEYKKVFTTSNKWNKTNSCEETMTNNQNKKYLKCQSIGLFAFILAYHEQHCQNIWNVFPKLKRI